MDIHRISRVKFTNPNKNQVLKELRKARILGKNISPTLTFQNNLYKLKFEGNRPTGWFKSKPDNKEYIPTLPEFRHLKKVSGSDTPLKRAKEKALTLVSFYVRRYLLFILFIILSSFVENWSLQQIARIGASKNGPNSVGVNTQAARLSTLREEWPHRVTGGVAGLPSWGKFFLIPPLPKRISNYSVCKPLQGNPLLTLPIPLSLVPLFKQLYEFKQSGSSGGKWSDLVLIIQSVPIAPTLQYLGGGEFLNTNPVSDTRFKNPTLLFDNIKKWKDTMLYLAQYSGRIANAANEALLNNVVKDLLGLWLPPGVNELVSSRIIPAVGYWLRQTDNLMEQEFKSKFLNQTLYRKWAKSASRFVCPPPNELTLLISDRIRLYGAKKNKKECEYDRSYIEEWAEKVKNYLLKTNINQKRYETYNAARQLELQQAYLKKAIDALIPFSSKCNIQNTNVNRSYIGKINNFVREHPTMYVKTNQHKEKLKNLVVCEKKSLLNIYHKRHKCAPLKKST